MKTHTIGHPAVRRALSKGVRARKLRQRWGIFKYRICCRKQQALARLDLWLARFPWLDLQLMHLRARWFIFWDLPGIIAKQQDRGRYQWSVSSPPITDPASQVAARWTVYCDSLAAEAGLIDIGAKQRTLQTQPEGFHLVVTLSWGHYRDVPDDSTVAKPAGELFPDL